MTDDRASTLSERINQDMRAAMKARDQLKLDELRSLLARISNAEAVDVPTSGAVMGQIAGAASGVGSTEVARKQLTHSDLEAVITAELRELQTALAGVDAESEYASALRIKIAVVQAYL